MSEPQPTSDVNDIPLFRLSEKSFDYAVRGGFRQHIPVEAIPYLKAEGTFKSFITDNTTEPPFLDEEDQIAISEGRLKCPTCLGTRSIDVISVGSKTGLRVMTRQNCKCIVYFEFWSRWHDVSLVPIPYRNSRLMALEILYNQGRFSKSKFSDATKARELFKFVRDHKTKSYLLHGRGGTGKTTLLMALYHEALLWASRKAYRENISVEHVWKVGCNQLSTEFRNWEMRDADNDSTKVTKPPTITREKVIAAQKAGLRPCLFLEEFDKWKLKSEFQQRQFFDILDAIYNTNDEGSNELSGFVVCTSNLNPGELVRSLESNFSEALLRRIYGPPRGVVVDFDTGSVRPDFSITVQDSAQTSASAEAAPVRAVVPETPQTSVVPQTTPALKEYHGHRNRTLI